MGGVRCSSRELGAPEIKWVGRARPYILLIDGDRDVATAHANILRRSGFTVNVVPDTAHTWSEVRNWAHARHEVVLLDHRTFGGRALSIARLLRDVLPTGQIF